MSLRARLLPLAASALVGCIPMAFGISVTGPPPAPAEPPVPLAFEGEAAPELTPTGVPELFAARSVDPHLYYLRSRERWYRWAFHRWYEAFSWDGNWFPIERAPRELLVVTPERGEKRRGAPPPP